MSDRSPSQSRMLVRQIAYQTKIFVRTPRAAFFTVIFPLFFLFLFNSLFGSERLPDGFRYAQRFTPGIATFAVISSCYTGLAISISMARDAGILKRVRGTPLAPWMYMAGRIGSSVLIGTAAVVIMFAVSVPAFHVQIYAQSILAAAVTVVVGAATFCALALAVTALVSSGEAAPAVVNATLFPILFISNIFFDLNTAPAWLRAVGWAFPIKHFAVALQNDFNVLAFRGAGFEWGHLGALAAWGVAGMIVALRTFKWEPSPTAGRRRRARRVSAA